MSTSANTRSVAMDANMANEQAWTPPKATRRAPYRWNDGSVGTEIDIGEYQVCVRWDWCGHPTEPSSAMLQIARADGGSVFDWRDMQAIKSLVCGPEWEAVELYPAERRHRDPSNARYLWARKTAFPFGFSGRLILNSDAAIAPQRPFAEVPS